MENLAEIRMEIAKKESWPWSNVESPRYIKENTSVYKKNNFSKSSSFTIVKQTSFKLKLTKTKQTTGTNRQGIGTESVSVSFVM